MSVELLCPAPKPKSPKTRPMRAKAMTQLLELQEQAHADALNLETPIHVRAAIMRAWCDLQEEKRKLQMRPLPKSIDVSKLGKGKRKAQAGPAYLEPGPNQAPEPAKSSINSVSEQPKPTQSPDNQVK